MFLAHRHQYADELALLYTATLADERLHSVYTSCACVPQNSHFRLLHPHMEIKYSDWR